MAMCQNRCSIVSQDTSFKSSCWLIELANEAFIPCQTFDRQECQVVLRQSFAKVNTGADMHTNTQKYTCYNIAPRGLGHPADGILFLLNGSCVTKDNLASPWPGYLRGIWMPPCLTCGLSFLCFVLGTAFPSSLAPSFLFLSLLLHYSLSCRLKWSAEGGIWLAAPLPAPPLPGPYTHPHPFRIDEITSLYCLTLRHNDVWSSHVSREKGIDKQTANQRKEKRHVNGAIYPLSIVQPEHSLSLSLYVSFSLYLLSVCSSAYHSIWLYTSKTNFPKAESTEFSWVCVTLFTTTIYIV